MIAENLRRIEKIVIETAVRVGRNPADIRLVAVSKHFPVEAIRDAFAAGQQYFGENYVQELREKHDQVPSGVHFHFIGHLQTNKAKTAADCCDMVESVDRIKLAMALHHHLLANGRQIDVLVQVNIGEDPHKAGITTARTADLLLQIQPLETLRVRGLMTMPPLGNHPEESRPWFRQLRQLATALQEQGLLPIENMQLSMGMSGDFPIAIEEGATIIRIGTAIFGERH